jgi:hypothetical protein
MPEMFLYWMISHNPGMYVRIPNFGHFFSECITMSLLRRADPQTTAMSEEKCPRDLNVPKCNESDERKLQTLPLYMLSTVGILYLYV